MKNRKRILLVEDSQIIRLATEHKLKDFGYQPISATTGEEAVELARSIPDLSLILMDIDLGSGIKGTEAASQILEQKRIPIVFYSSHSEKEIVDLVQGITRYGYILKNSGDFVLKSTIEMALELFAAQEAQKKATRDLIASEARYRAIFENHHTPMLIINPANGKLVDANPAAVEFYGYEYQDLLRLSIDSINLMSPDEIKSTMNLARKEQRSLFLFKHRLANGEVRQVEVSSGPIEIKGENLLYSIIKDISQQILAEEALARNLANYRIIIDNIPVGIIHFDNQGAITATNRACATLFDRPVDDLVGFSLLANTEPKIAAILRQVLAGESLNTEGYYTTIKTKQKLFLRLVAQPHIVDGLTCGGTFLIEDRTEENRHEETKKLIEAKMRDEQRMASIGMLADGIAHEVNNPLMAIINLAQLGLDDQTQTRRMLKEIIVESERIATIVRGLISFSSGQKYSTVKPIQPADLVETIINLATEIFRHDEIEFVVKVEPDLPKIECRSQEIQQVLLSLVTNAREAISNARLKRSFKARIALRALKGLNPDLPGVRFEVEDNADLISPDEESLVFDPFFSDKTGRTRPGLGLAVSHGIAHEHGGSLTLKSSPEGTTIFTLHLPNEKPGDKHLPQKPMA